MSEPIVLIVSGPSGVGKTTLVKRLIGEFPNLQRSVSLTTRAPRDGELIEAGYFFVTEDGFARSVLRKELVEHEFIHGAWYGTPRKGITHWLEHGCDVVAVVEPNGALAIFEEFASRTLMVFIHPPSLEELMRRLQARDPGKPELLVDRITIASQQIARSEMYDVHITNENADVAYEQLKAAYLAARDG